MSKLLENIIGGGLAGLVLYGVAKVAYSAGKEAGANEQEEKKASEASAETQKESEPDAEDIPDAQRKTQSKIGLIWGVRRFVKNKQNAIANVLDNPDGHKIEAYTQGDEIHIHVKKKGGK